MADPKTRALQLNTEGLFKLLGGSTSDRNRFWEIFKGITTPIEYKLIQTEIETLAVAIKQVEQGTKALRATAEQIGKRSAPRTAGRQLATRTAVKRSAARKR